MKDKLLCLVSSLKPLWDFYPIGCLVEETRMAISGEGGLTEADINKLINYSERWSKLNEEQKKIFSKSFSDIYIGVMLLLYLNGTRLSGYQKECLERKYEEYFLYRTPINIKK